MKAFGKTKHIWTIAILLLYCGTVFGAEVLPPTQVMPIDYPALSYSLNGPIFRLPNIWKYQDGDNIEFAREKFDDSNWKAIEVNQENSGSGWRWYRIAFRLPTTLENHSLLLDLGRISVYDEVFVNGVQAGHFGTPPPHLAYGASTVWRKYPISGEHFHPGLNVLAVRVYLGGKGGLYQGSYTLQALSDDAIIGRMNLKTTGSDALRTLLTESSYLNAFTPGSDLLVGPDLLQLFGAIRQGCLEATIIDARNKLIEREALDISLAPMEWTRSLFRFKTPVKVGDYHCRLSCVVNGKVVWNKNLLFHVKPFDLLHLNPPVDSSLASLGDQMFPLQVSASAMGHFGPRELNANAELFDNVEKTDVRSGLAYSAHIIPQSGAPELFLAGVRPVPQDAEKPEDFHRAPGAIYDGLDDAWAYGYVRPNRAGAVEKISIKSTSWAKRTYHYQYQNKDWMDFSISAISPAWMVTSNAQKMRVFEGIEKHGIGLPTHLAYESNMGVKIVNAETGIDGRDMSANWVLAWFNGGTNWNEFDMPYLFVLQNRPDRVRTYENSALFFAYPTTTGTIQGMPLYGVTLQRPDQTANWVDSLPKTVQERCRYWSRVLVNAPDEIKRTANVNYEKDQLTVKDEFAYLNIQDSWGTSGIKIAPISPVLALATSSGNIDIAVSRPTKDLQMATLQGPLVAADNADKMVFRVNGILHYIREVREIKGIENAPAKEVQANLNQIVADGLERDLQHHPWDRTVARRRLRPGLQQSTYTNLMLTLPYLNPDLRNEVEREIALETEKYFLYSDTPDPALAQKLQPELRDKPLITVVTNPITGLQLATMPISAMNFGIDQTYYSSLNIYLIWLYVDTFHRYNWARTQYAKLQRSFNVLRNSHDWDINASWDTFSGIRVGNGLQEGGGKYAGAVAMARIAKELGDQTTSDEAAYYAVMEAVAMQAQLAATDYLKQRRPWVNSNTHHEDIEYAEKLRFRYYAEFNEFAGLSQAVILPHGLLNAPGSFILCPLPEVMRLYQEIWPKFTNDFYDPKYDAIIKTDRRFATGISLDAFVYQMTKYPQTVQQVFDVRKNLDIDWWDKLPDYRAYLDSRGEIGYRNLW